MADIYGLTVEELAGYDRMGSKLPPPRPKTWCAPSTRPARPRWAGCCSPWASATSVETTARDVARHFGDMDAIMDAEEAQLLEVSDVAGGRGLHPPLLRRAAQPRYREALKRQGVRPVAEAAARAAACRARPSS